MKRQQQKPRRKMGRRNHRLAKQTEQISIRMDPPLKSFLERWGNARSPTMKPASVARHGVESFKEMVEELKSNWLEVERRAADAGKRPGTYIGWLLNGMLEAERKQKK